MSGNAWEWTQDDWEYSYGSGAATDPTGASSGPFRVSRGGGWASVASDASVSGRGYGVASDCIGCNQGFRLGRSTP